VKVVRGSQLWAAASRVCGKSGDDAPVPCGDPLMLVDTSIWIEHLHHNKRMALNVLAMKKRYEPELVFTSANWHVVQ
jgi:hypothetical protein